MNSRLKHLYEFGPFVLDPADRILLRDGSLVPLQPKVFDTLLVLVENGGHLVEKNELMQAVWPGEKFVEEGNLNKNISKLRLALGEDGGGTKYIVTVPKSGYRFAAEVRDVNGGGIGELIVETQTRTSIVVEEEIEGEPSGASRSSTRAADALVVKPTTEAAAASARPGGGPERRPIRSAAFAAAGIVVALTAAVYLFRPVSGGEAIDSVAVMPFVNETNNPDLEFLSDGVSENLINSLSRLPELKVIARSSTFKYKGRWVEPQEVARVLGVQSIVSGRVARLGEELRVSVELVNARDGTQLWGEQFKYRASDLLAVQADISREIADGLRLHLTSGERQQLARRETVSPQANELLLRGRLYRSRATTEGRMKALEYFRRAIEADPTYALAYVELSATYGGMVNAQLLDQKEYLPKAEEAARKGLELDEGLAEAHLAMADVKENAWDWAAAEHEFRRALELSPNLADAHARYAYHLIIQGRDEEALASARRAKELDPLSRGANQAVVHGLMLAGQTDKAVDIARDMLELDSRNPSTKWFVGSVYQRTGRYSEAIAAFQEAIRLGDTSLDMQVALASVYAEAGENERARAILRRLEADKELMSPVGLAIIHASLGQREQSFALLERACASRDQQLIWVGVERRFSFAPLQSDQRFKNIMRCVGFTQ